MKLDKPYIEVSAGSYLVKKKYSTIEIAELINELITLRKKCEKKQDKSKIKSNEQ